MTALSLGMMNLETPTRPVLRSWLQNVHQHLEVRRSERQAAPRPKRNRDRERARREARQLFVQYYQETAMQGL